MRCQIKTLIFFWDTLVYIYLYVLIFLLPVKFIHFSNNKSSNKVKLNHLKQNSAVFPDDFLFQVYCFNCIGSNVLNLLQKKTVLYYFYEVVIETMFCYIFVPEENVAVF